MIHPYSQARPTKGPPCEVGLIESRWRYDPTLYAPPRYRRGCSYEAFIPDTLLELPAIAPTVAGTISRAEECYPAAQHGLPAWPSAARAAAAPHRVDRLVEDRGDAGRRAHARARRSTLRPRPDNRAGGGRDPRQHRRHADWRSPTRPKPTPTLDHISATHAALLARTNAAQVAGVNPQRAELDRRQRLQPLRRRLRPAPAGERAALLDDLIDFCNGEPSPRSPRLLSLMPSSRRSTPSQTATVAPAARSCRWSCAGAESRPTTCRRSASSSPPTGSATSPVSPTSAKRERTTGSKASRRPQPRGRTRIRLPGQGASTAAGMARKPRTARHSRRRRRMAVDRRSTRAPDRLATDRRRGNWPHAARRSTGDRPTRRGRRTAAFDKRPAQSSVGSSGAARPLRRLRDTERPVAKMNRVGKGEPKSLCVYS